jgi:hypothetical protein
MSSLSRRAPSFALLVLVALIVGACGSPGGAGSATPGGSTAGSGSLGSLDPGAACATAPEPDASSLNAWDPSSQRPTLFPVIVSSSQVCGENRFLFSFLDKDNKPAATPERSVSVAFYDLARDPATPVATTTGEFLWAIEGERGLYVTTASFSEAGLWGVEFTTEAPGAAKETIRVQFQVRPDTPTIAIGEKAPASKTPTLADVGGDPAKLSTDADPARAFYETSVADALAAKKPFVLIFATPKFCTSAQCGPTLDRLKPIATAHPGVAFINVEPFELEESGGQLQPVLTNGALTPAAATQEWGLTSEPWIFAVGADGVVRGSYEGVVGDKELETVLTEIEKGA